MIVEQGLMSVLRFLLRDSAMNGEVGLFTNAITVNDGTVFTDLTEATFPGYARQPLTALVWPDPTINPDGEAESDGPTITWEATSAPGSPQDVTGIFVTIDDPDETENLFLCYVFPDPVTITDAGDQVEKKINWFCDNY